MITDPAAVEETLASLLGLSRGTWERVLFSAQGDVGDSLDRLDTEGDLRELNERLRRSVFETDGVSLERLAEGIETRRAAAFGRWDAVLKRPEETGPRPALDPGAGTIVNAWYEQEAARRALEAAEHYYRRLDELNETLARPRRRTRNSPAGSNATSPSPATRSSAPPRCRTRRSRGQGKGPEGDFPGMARPRERGGGEGIARDLPPRKSGFVRRGAFPARAWEAAAKSRRILEEGEKLSVAVAAAKRERDAVGAIDAEAVAAIETLERERERVRARIEAAALRIRVSADRATSLETRSGVGDPVPGASRREAI